MIVRLVPCAECSRHMRATEPACPFCGAPPPAPGDLPPVVAPPRARLGRAALFAFGAAAAGVVAVSGCGDDSFDAPYGAPPADMGMPPPLDSSFADTGEAGVDAGDDAGDAAADAGDDAGDAAVDAGDAAGGAADAASDASGDAASDAATGGDR